MKTALDPERGFFCTVVAVVTCSPPSQKWRHSPGLRHESLEGENQLRKGVCIPRAVVHELPH